MYQKNKIYHTEVKKSRLNVYQRDKSGGASSHSLPKPKTSLTSHTLLHKQQECNAPGPLWKGRPNVV